MNAFDQMREALVAAVARQSPAVAPEPGIDWATWVTAVATIVLALTTWVLFWETKRMRETSDRVFREAQEPHFIVYTEVDGMEGTQSIVIENVTDVPAFNVNVQFEPDMVIRLADDPEGDGRQLSDFGLKEFAVIPPRYRLVRTYAFNRGNRGLALVPEFNRVTARFSFELRDRSPRSEFHKLTDHLSRLDWMPRKNTLAAIREQIETSVGSLYGELMSIAHASRRPFPVNQARSVVKGTQIAAQIPRPVRTRYLGQKWRRR